MNPLATIDDVRRFWDAQPCNVRHSAAQPGTARWSWEVTERKYKVEPHIRTFANWAQWRDKYVLEVGCGIGTDTIQFGVAGAWVDAIDVSVESAKLAHERVKLLKLESRVRVYVANVEDWIPVNGPDIKYDLAYAFGVLHHTPHAFRAVCNIKRRLVPGGEFRLMLYAKWSLKNLLGEQPEAQVGCPIARVYTARQARALLEEAGFEVLSIRKMHIFPYRVEDYVQYRYVKRWYYRWMPAWMFSRLESFLGWHLLIVARRPL